MANTLNGIPKLVPRANTPEKVRSYLYDILTLRHDYDTETAKKVIQSWTYGDIKDLLKEPRRRLQRDFGFEVGTLIHKAVQQDVLTDFMNSFHGLFMTSLLAICVMVSVIYAVIAFSLPTWSERLYPLRRFLIAAGPATFAVILQFPWCPAKAILFCTSFFFMLIALFAWIVRWMEIESDKDDERELMEQVKAAKEEKREEQKEEVVREAPSTSEDEGGYNLRQRKGRPARQ
ncbi:hypothetical protein KEM54_005573 [Ascosphaera aggregata]|nr:hypothetical protein KEM54_005573 [Ascosphaera aggregata]